MAELPSGTVTLLFTDIEGSTRLLDELGPERYRDALGEHRRLLREAFGRHHGYEVDYEGNAFFVAFQDARAGVSAAREAQAALEDGPISVRVGLHTGQPLLDPPKYVGRDVHLAARIMSAGHGGQVLVSRATLDCLDGIAVSDLGEHRLKDFDEPVALFQLGSGSFPPLKTISNTNLPRPPHACRARLQRATCPARRALPALPPASGCRRLGAPLPTSESPPAPFDSPRRASRAHPRRGLPLAWAGRSHRHLPAAREPTRRTTRSRRERAAPARS